MFLPRPRCAGRGRKEAAREVDEDAEEEEVVVEEAEGRICGGGTGAEDGK